MSFESFEYCVKSILPNFLSFSEEDKNFALENPSEFIFL